MRKILDVLKKDRLYILLLIFIILLNIAMLLPAETKKKGGARIVSTKVLREAKEKKKETFDEMLLKRKEAENVLTKNAHLALMFSLFTLLVLAVLFLGLIVDIIFISMRFSKHKFDIRTYDAIRAGWNIWDVCKVVILFLFFGYMLIIIEAFLCKVFPLFKNDNFRMIVNSSSLDIITVAFILYFTPGRLRERLVSLGMSVKNFSKNIFYGIVGYLAMVPVLAVILIITAIVINLFKYVPEKQPVVELFMKEKDAMFLFYTSLFAAIVGPFIEELFFRGFMYNALKKFTGAFWAMTATAVIFAALHTNVVGFFPIMALGMVLAYLYEKTGTLVSSITVHIIHNLSMVMFIFLVKQLGV